MWANIYIYILRVPRYMVVHIKTLLIRIKYIYKYIYILGQEYPKYIYICKNTILCIRKQDYITNVIKQKNIIYAPMPYNNKD